LGQVEMLRVLPAQAFWPAPKIESALVRIIRHDQLGNSARDFSAFIHALFSARRKMLRKALAQAGHEAVDFPDLDLQQRVEVLSPQQLLNLWTRLHCGNKSL
ncbi:MAG TPA: rRNA adenine N-6-methyltransferase family protein, partial [Tepidisphaeraceae bacterium]|nr:rRNA adenine N-6-methyltransferase family protein [Tepidisphaeraceae bacterium]